MQHERLAHEGLGRVVDLSDGAQLAGEHALAGRLELSEEVAFSVASMSFVDPSLQRLAARRVAPDDASQRVGHAFDLVLDVKNIAATPNSIGDRSTTPLMTPANSAAAACTLGTVHGARADVHAHEVAQELRRLRVALHVGLRRPVRS